MTNKTIPKFLVSETTPNKLMAATHVLFMWRPTDVNNYYIGPTVEYSQNRIVVKSIPVTSKLLLSNIYFIYRRSNEYCFDFFPVLAVPEARHPVPQSLRGRGAFFTVSAENGPLTFVFQFHQKC